MLEPFFAQKINGKKVFEPPKMNREDAKEIMEQMDKMANYGHPLKLT